MSMSSDTAIVWCLETSGLPSLSGRRDEFYVAFRPQTESAVDVVKFESEGAAFSVWDQHADSWEHPDTASGSGWTTDRKNDWTLDTN